MENPTGGVYWRSTQPLSLINIKKNGNDEYRRHKKEVKGHYRQ
jgi:hypothetical protein